MKTDVVIYCNCMEELKLRVGIILSIVEGRLSIGREDFDSELACVQLRKALELIAFASLSANKVQYSKAYRKFSKHWNAKSLLNNIEKIHPDFYPKPVVFSEDISQGKHLLEVKEGFLTRNEFVELYDKCSEVLHARNPFRTGPKIINFRYSIKEWIERIQKLLALHQIRLVDTQDIWLVQMQHPQDSKVHAFPASPVNIQSKPEPHEDVPRNDGEPFS